MKYIQKHIKNEPVSLKATRSTPGATFGDCKKSDIRTALLIEQGYICAYCMRRIDDAMTNGKPNTRIEHYGAQSHEESLRMNYLNMLGVCDGNEGNPKHLQTCDKRRGNQTLTLDPRTRVCEDLIAYQDNGTIYAKKEGEDKELNEVLGLNNENLIRERFSVVKIARERMQRYYRKKKKNQSWTKSDLTKEIKYWSTQKDNKYPEYCRIAIYYLEKKLARL